MLGAESGFGDIGYWCLSVCMVPDMFKCVSATQQPLRLALSPCGAQRG